MQYQISKVICEYSETTNNINKIIKIQAYVRMRQWYIPHIKKYIFPLLNKLYKRDKKAYQHETTLFGNTSKESVGRLQIAFEVKQKQMKEGDLSQILIGNWLGWKDLLTGHPSGLDCRKNDNTIIMDVKNKHNTCNSGSEKALLDKLSKYKKGNPDTRCIWGIVNAKPGCKKLHQIIFHEGVEIEKIQGTELFKLVFTIGKFDYSERIIKMVQRFICEI